MERIINAGGTASEDVSEFSVGKEGVLTGGAGVNVDGRVPVGSMTN
jgi:hypothetical protein